MTYGSVRGVMKVGEGDRFSTAVPVQGVLPRLPAQGIANRERLLEYLKAEADKKPSGFGDTYGEGKHLGKLATLSGVAEAADAPELQTGFVTELKRRLEAWFTATPDKPQPVFYYNANWGALVGSRPSYGSDRPLNDHHFHYGYFIRAAAEVARLDPVWGGKGAFGTWFSGDIDCIHGINWLPFTPGSLYLGRHPDCVKKNHDRVVSVRQGGGDYTTGWGDLVYMFNALQDPASAAAFMEANPRCKLEGGNTHAFMYHWIHTLNNLGLNDAGVTADYPLVSVFSKNGRRTYAAYNGDAEPRTVTFSDGTRLEARPKTLTLQP